MANKPSRKQAAPSKEALLYDSARLVALFSSIGDGVIATDESGKITRVNRVALKLLGMKRSEMINKHFLSVVQAVRENGAPLDVFERHIVKAFQKGKTVHARSLYLRKDGDLVPVQVTVSPIILRGRPIGAIEVFRDLTDEIESDKLKSDFISIASHQLRTPLSAINMYARMLHDGMVGSLSEQQEPFIETILKSVERMNVLIDTLLNITRLEAGGITVKLQLVQLEELSQEMLTEFIPAAKAKNITLTSKLPANMKPFMTDTLLVKEVSANLLSNAIKYTPENGKVRFEMTETAEDIEWAVSDTGYGIPKSAQRNIFLKFFRAANITNKDVSGTGLGLYLIKSIAEALGGELWFESTENVGSTFHFRLPKFHVPAGKSMVK